MIRLITVIVTFIIISCAQTDKKADAGWKEIQIADYTFYFPPDFKLITQEGVDSYTGIIQGDSMRFNFDFGYYSNDLGETADDYLREGDWRINLPVRFMKEGVTYSQQDMPKVDVLNIRPATQSDSALQKGCDFVARCRHDAFEFDFPVSIPVRVKTIDFVIDTVDNHFRKIRIPQDSQNGVTGIYLKDLNGFNKSLNSFLALSMTARSLTTREQKVALEIFKTVQWKKAGNR